MRRLSLKNNNVLLVLSSSVLFFLLLSSRSPSFVVEAFATRTALSKPVHLSRYSPRLGSDATTMSTSFSDSNTNTAASSSSSSSITPPPSPPLTALERQNIRKKERKELIRREGGRFSFNTKYGALNPYAIYYGLMSIFLGLFWYVGLTVAQLFYLVTFNRIDKQRRLPILISQAWGVATVRLTHNYPKLENMDILKDFYKGKRPAMFVANHNSWMDIPFLGVVIGWRHNYKLVAKKELGKVPILGKAIKLGGHVMVDRANRKSQLLTLKRGIQYLKDGVMLCTFPEGTRSRDGRLGKFKNGAFKMAHKAGAPVIPVSIHGASQVMPPHWMFPCKPSHKYTKVVVHEPIESVGRTEAELADAVRQALINGLPEDQRPVVAAA